MADPLDKEIDFSKSVIGKFHRPNAELRMPMAERGRLRWSNGDDPAAVGQLGGIAARGKSGRPRSVAKRCPCGAMTLKRAQARGHQC